jgi:cell shape-determining protein MreD
VKPLAHVAFALLLAGLQAAVLRWGGGGALPLALLAACVVYVALHGGNVDGSIAAFGIGYVLDVTSATPKGLMTFLAVALFLAVRAISAAVDLRGRAAFGLLSGVGAFLLSLGALVLLRNAASPEAAPGAALLPRMLLESLLTGLLAPALLVPLRRIDARFHREEPGLLR